MKNQQSENKRKIIKVAILILLVGLYFILQRQYSEFSPERIRTIILSFGIYAPIMLMLFSLIRPLIAFPITVIYIASGLVFGTLWGGVLAVISAGISAMVAHTLAVKIGIHFFPVAWQKKILSATEKIENNGFRNMLFIRFIPMISFDLVSYAGGLAKVSKIPFVTGTLVGITPRVFAYTYVGANMLRIDGSEFWIALGILLFIFVVPFGVYQLINSRHNNKIFTKS